MKLFAITPDGAPALSIQDLPDIGRQVCESTVEMYTTMGFNQPWIGYLAVEDEQTVGTCAFKSAPVEGRVEVAYFTFPGNEGRGVATRMTERLIDIAQEQAHGVRICAQTLPEHNASTRVLEKLGFHKVTELMHPEDGRVWEWELSGQVQQGSAADVGPGGRKTLAMLNINEVRGLAGDHHV